MQIALFGGSFDPPHQAHQEIAEWMMMANLVDQVWFVPAQSHPFHKTMSPATDRLAMLQLLVADIHNPRIKICTKELEQTQTSYSFATLELLTHEQPGHAFSWIIGADNLKRFQEWHEYDQLLKKYTVWVYPRTGYEAKDLLPGMKLLSDFPPTSVSSTAIRSRVKNGEGIDDLVVDSVKKYIHTHQLYL